MKFEDVEEARQKLALKSKKIWQIGAVIGAAVFVTVIIINVASWVNNANRFGLFVMIPTLIFVTVFCAVIIAIVVVFATKKESVAYRKAYKAYFVEKIMRETFTDLEYSHDKGLSEEYLRNTGMVNTGDSYNSNDLTVAKYKNVKFVQSDVHIQEEETDSDGNTYYVTLFRGRFMFFEFPKKFSFVLELVGKRAGVAKVPRSSKNGKRLEKMKTESGEFNQRFKIFTEDGFEMFYILDPAFIEKIQAINDSYNGRVMFGFLDNKLMVGLNDGKDSFEPPKPSRPIDEKTEFIKNQADLKVITDFVDYLRLDKKLFQ